MSRPSRLTAVAAAGLIVGALAMVQAGQTDTVLGAAGLWRYVSLGRPNGDDVKLDGLFVFQNGRFVQQALNLGDPVDAQVAQAHAGTYTVSDGRIHLHADVGLVIDPRAATPVVSSPDRAHELTPTAQTDRLVLTFGSGTVQKFVRVGRAAGRIVPLSRGALALVDGHFVLVFQDGSRALAGSGTYTENGPALRFAPERWLTVRDGRVTYAKAPVDATVNATALVVGAEPPLPLAK
ncbi:MAG: hypothetical protein U0Q12_19490 [Vicinamibacterales bacterium]